MYPISIATGSAAPYLVDIIFEYLAGSLGITEEKPQRSSRSMRDNLSLLNQPRHERRDDDPEDQNRGPAQSHSLT